jgi:hypothetical protein
MLPAWARKPQSGGGWKAIPGKTFFELETVGQPSRWNALRALRVLNWWAGKGSAVSCR